MTKRRVIIILLACGLLAAVLYAPRADQTEPSYQGRSLSTWIGRLYYPARLPIPQQVGLTSLLQDYPPGGSFENERYVEAADAIRHIGTNALPFLMSWITNEPPAWQWKLQRGFQSIGIPADTYRSYKEIRATKATIALQVLGSTAKSAIPELTRLLNPPTTHHLSIRAAAVLPYIGEPAVPPLANVLTNKASDHMRRVWALWGLASMGTNATSAGQAFINCLHDEETDLRSHVIFYLPNLNVPPALAVSPLRAILTNSDAQLREAATNALLKICPSALTNAPPK